VGQVLDAYALIALLAAEPAEPAVKRILRQGQATMPAVNLAEALDALERREGIAEGELRQLIEPLPIRILPLTEPIAWTSAALRARHYHRRRRAVSVADCVLVASAGKGDQIVTNDPALIEMARAEDLEVVEP
jgi:predicted nucleic acid-binding protein